MTFPEFLDKVYALRNELNAAPMPETANKFHAVRMLDTILMANEINVMTGEKINSTPRKKPNLPPNLPQKTETIEPAPELPRNLVASNTDENVAKAKSNSRKK